jgi:hypothetical protein
MIFAPSTMTRGVFAKTMMLKAILTLALCGLSNSLQFFEDAENVVIIKDKKDLATKVLVMLWFDSSEALRLFLFQLFIFQTCVCC